MYGEAEDVDIKYRENQTSWKFFERRMDREEEGGCSGSGNDAYNLEARILLEILKELQYRNKTVK